MNLFEEKKNITKMSLVQVSKIDVDFLLLLFIRFIKNLSIKPKNPWNALHFILFLRNQQKKFRLKKEIPSKYFKPQDLEAAGGTHALVITLVRLFQPILNGYFVTKLCS